MHSIKKTLDSLLEFTRADFKLYVVDNSSTDGTPEFIEQNYPQLELIRKMQPDAKKIGLLYDVGQDSSAAPIAAAGFFKYNGLNLERFIIAFVRSEFLCAGRRVYQSENIYRKLFIKKGAKDCD